MKQLAIKGHKTRGKEVIELLKMMGGNNYANHSGDRNVLYFIHNSGEILADFDCYYSNYTVFTIEEFEEKFPYKVGDKVQPKGAKSYDLVYVIEYMTWVNNRIEYEVRPSYDLNHTTGLVPLYVEDLKLYKEGNMERKIESFEILENYCADEVKIEFDPSKYEIVERKNGYYVVKKQPKYPRTFKECLNILYCKSVLETIIGHKTELLFNLEKLLICRDAYWKITGEQMGLGKPWEPDWKDFSTQKYSISVDKDEIITSCRVTGSRILVFPTEEMRNTFYNNFKELIEKCKELL